MTATPYLSEEILLDPEIKSSQINDFEKQLLSKIVGQNNAIKTIVNMYQIFRADLSAPERPIGNLLFLGPTGTGKTRIVEAIAEILFGSPRAFIKIDCAEFQHSHEIAKIIGSPPGYLGHRETPPLLTQESINQYQTERTKITFLLFDEIEKANESLWRLLLGILDKGRLTLGDNRKVDFSQCVIFMTSNLGTREISDYVFGEHIGFRKSVQQKTIAVNPQIYRIAMKALKYKFSPEFMNRIDKVVVFQSLTQEHLKQILDIELNEFQKRVMAQKPDRQFIFSFTLEAKEFILREGTDLKYGARHLKRAIEIHLVRPISILLTSGQIDPWDNIKVGFDPSKEKLIFKKEKRTFNANYAQ